MKIEFFAINVYTRLKYLIMEVIEYTIFMHS